MRTIAAGLRGGGRGRTLATVSVGWLLILGLRFTVPALLPQVKATFTIDNATAGVAVTVIWVTYALMQFPAGLLVDRVGERVLLAISLATAAGGLLLLGVAPAFGIFLVAAAGFGLGTGLFGPARGTVLSRTFERDGAAFGLTLAAGSVGAAVLPLLAGLLVATVGWRPLIVASVPPFLVVAVATWFVVPPRAGGADVPWPSLGASLRGAAIAVRTRSVIVGVLAVTLLLFTFQGVTAFLPTYLIEEKGLDQGTAAILYAGLFLSGALFQTVAGTAADRYGDRAVLGVVAGVSVLPLAAIPYAGGLAALGTLVALVGVRMAIGPVNNAYLVAVLPKETRGTAWGLLRTLFFAVGATGSAFVGALADRGLFDESFLILAGITAVGAVLYLFLPSRRDV